MSNAFDGLDGLGVTLTAEEKRVAELEDKLMELRRERDGIAAEGDSTTLHDRIIQRLEAQLDAALADLEDAAG